MRLECPIHGVVLREETVKGYEIAKDEYVRFEPEKPKALEQTSSSALVIDSFVPEGAIDPVSFEDTYYLGAGKNGGRGYRVLVQGLDQTKWAAVDTLFDGTKTASSSSGSTSPPGFTTRSRSTGAPSRRSVTKSGRSPSD
jgi:non-homologous end joining protein Ku